MAAAAGARSHLLFCSHIPLFTPSVLFTRLQAHAAALLCIGVCAEQVRGAAFATGGADGFVKLWGGGYAVLRTIDLNELCRTDMLDPLGRPRSLPPPRGVRVSAVCWDAAGDRLLVGTQHNAVLRLKLFPHDVAATPLTHGHAGGRLPAGGWRAVRALAEHPRADTFATTGDDGGVHLWSLRPHTLRTL